MGLFSRRRNASRQPSTPFFAPQGVATTRQRLVRSAPFTFNPNQQPATSISLVKQADRGSSGVSLTKTFEVAQQAIETVELPGLRCNVVLMVDGSGSMSYDYREGLVQKMLVRALGFALNLDTDGIPVFTYGYRVSKPVQVDLSNYANAPSMIVPDFGTTDMTGGLNAALDLARQHDKLTLIVNITDGDPDNRVSMMNAAIAASGEPVMIKNLAIRSVPFLEEMDDLPSQVEIKTDAGGNPVKNSDGSLQLWRNDQGLRLIDNVDSQEVSDPHGMSDEEFAHRMATEISDCIEVMGRVGLLTGVPGVTVDFPPQ